MPRFRIAAALLAAFILLFPAACAEEDPLQVDEGSLEELLTAMVEELPSGKAKHASAK